MTPQSRHRTPIRTVPTLARAGGILRRVVGSTDARGQGVEFALADVGPFILLDDARGLEGPNQPPFGAHPHAGLVALSIVPDGGSWQSRANVPGMEYLAFGEGQVVMTVAGRGIVHDETSVGDGAHGMLQLILRLPAARRDTAPTIAAWTPTEVAPGVHRLFDPTRLAIAGLDAAAYRCRMGPGQRATLPVPTSHTTGFVYPRDGSVGIGGHALPEHGVAELGADGDQLELTAEGDRPIDCLVATAAGLPEPWAKLLGHEGFVVAADEAAAAAKLAEYRRDGDRFGQRE